MATMSRPVDKPAEAIATAAATPTTRFFGLRAPSPAPTARDFPGENCAIPFIHFGIAASSSGFGRPRNWRTDANKRSRPSTSWTDAAPFDGPEPDDRLMEPATATSIPSTPATPTTNPTRYAPALGTGLSVNSRRISAMIGIGEIVTAIASGRIAPSTPFIDGSLPECASLQGRLHRAHKSLLEVA